MSYCRFSTDDFQCDLYVYSDAHGGYTIHVAKNRPKYKEELPPEVEFIKDNIDAWLDRHKKIMEMVEAADRETITLPHAGVSFYCLPKDAALERLAELKALGYRFPDYVIESITEEEDE